MSKIVIIDDNTLIAKLYETNLMAEGHTVKVAFDGAAGLQLVREFKPDVVLLDLMMPEMSGVEIIKELRKEAEFTELPILAYSGGDDEVLNAAREAGASSIISKKESSLKEILKHLNELLLPDGQWHFTPSLNNEAVNEIQKEEKKILPLNERVLIVEDDALIVMIVKNIVEKAGYQVVVARDGREAYRILTNDADFVAGIFDVHVPYIEGPDLLRHMRTEKRLMKIPVMIMTTEEDIKAQLDSLSAGAAVFLKKPIERGTFEALFMGLISKKLA